MCGAARMFLTPAGIHVAEKTMTCQWDKTWSPDTELPGSCDWVACLRPPLPPFSTNLQVTGWLGEPIPFGDEAHYVCRRGFQFEDDPAQVEVTYSCQDGTVKDQERGFVDVPKTESEWPRCVRGLCDNVTLCILQCVTPSSTV